MTEEARPGGAYRVAWAVLIIVSALLVLVGLAFMFLPMVDGLDLLGVRSETRLFGVATVAIGLFSTFLTWYGVRDGSPLSVRIMWTLPVVAAGISAVFFSLDELTAAVAYAGVAALSAWMLAILERRLS